MSGIWILGSLRGNSKTSLGFSAFSAVYGLLEGHQDMHLLSLTIAGMLSMQSVNWMARMVGVWNFLIIQKVVEAVVGIVVGTVVGVRIRSAMSVVNLVTLLVNVACVLAHEAREVGDVEALALVAVRVQLMDMGAGAIVHVGEDLLGAKAYHLIVVAATAGHHHIVILVVIHLMLMEIKVGLELKQI